MGDYYVLHCLFSLSELRAMGLVLCTYQRIPMVLFRYRYFMVVWGYHQCDTQYYNLRIGTYSPTLYLERNDRLS